VTAGLTFGGFDLALNHSGAILLDEGGDLLDYRYLTNQKSSADKAKKRSTYHKPEGSTDERNMNRLAHHALWSRGLLRAWAPSYSYLEGYAFGTPKGELTGEMAGAWKLQWWSACLPFRIMDVSSIKMFAAHSGKASKEAVCRAVAERWGIDFGRLNKKWKSTQRTDKKTGGLYWTEPPKDLRQTEEDLCDAYVMAKMCWTEWRIRAGLILPSQLEHDAERRVYIRTTKAYPENVLARPWIVRV